MGCSRGFWRIYVVILVLACAPIVGLPLFNSVEPCFAGFPLVWFYCLVWVVLVFVLLLIVYFIDRRLGGMVG